MSFAANAGTVAVSAVFAAFLAFGSAAQEAASAEGVWQAGVARVEITPEEPLWLGGYAARTKPAESALQPLWAKALALKDASGTCAVLVTTDILGYPKDFAERVRSRIEKACNLPRANVMLSASHTHSAPVIDATLKCIYPFDTGEEERLRAYAAKLEEALAVLAGDALKNLAPASLHAGNGVARFAVNRRNNTEGQLTPTTSLQGPNDHAVPVLKVARPDGTLAAVVFGYACHATVLDGYQWSGDYPGFAQAALEAQYPGSTALFFAGCGADQNPLPRRSVPLVRQYGATLAAAVARMLEEPMAPLASKLAVAYREVDLPLESAPTEETLRERAAAASGYEQRCTEALLQKLQQDGSLPASYPYPVQTWRLGTQLLVALGGETVVSYAIGLKERLGQEIFVMGYANDLMAYIPSERVREEGGYEGRGAQIIYGLPAPWAAGLEERILSEAEAQAVATAGSR